MTSHHRAGRFRVDVPTLEPDPVFLGMLTDLSTRSPSVGPRTARSAGLRMIVATASVAVVATATWAGGTGMGTPLSPANAPAQQEPSGPPSPGDVATPQRDVSDSPGSPVSPGLPGTQSAPGDRATGGSATANDARNGRTTGKNTGKATAKKAKDKKSGERTEKSARKDRDRARQGDRAVRPRDAVSRSGSSPRK